MKKLVRVFLIACVTAIALCGAAATAGAAVEHYCSGCYLAWPSEKEGPNRHSYTLNYGHSLAGNWIGVRAHDVNHSPYGSNAQNWNESTHSYSGANLLFMIVGNIYDDGVGNFVGIYANAHGNY
jgi:hypothetical protein